MATQVGQAFIPVSADLSGFQRDVQQGTTGALGTVKGFAKTTGSLIGGAFVAKGAFDFLQGATDAASSMNETVSKSNTIFGESGKSIERWAGTASRSIGQSKQQALEAAGTFGNLFVQLGIGVKPAAEMSKQMVKLASDFASFHNADISEVINAQSAAFRGEYDALQRFVPTINAAAVEQEALAATGKKATKELTLQEKAIAVQTLMMKGAGDAAGDFSRTSDGLANRQRIMSAQWADMTAQLGAALIPAITKVAGLLISTVEWYSRNSAVLTPLIVILGSAAAGFAAVAAAGSLATSVAAMFGTTLTISMGPIGLIVAAVAALAAGLIYAYKNSETFRNVVDGAFRGVKATVGALWEFIRPIFVGWKFQLELIVKVVEKIASVLKTVGGGIGNVVGKVGGVIGKIPGFADGVRNFSGGPAVVGERGPELVNLPRGSDVLSNAELSELMGGGSGITHHWHVESRDPEVIYDVVRRRAGWATSVAGGL